MKFKPGFCKTSKTHLIIEGQFRTVDCGFILFENPQILNKFIEAFIKRIFSATVVKRLNEISAKIVEENVIISTDTYGAT